MAIVIGLIVRPLKEKIYAESGALDLNFGDKVIVKADHGIELGIVCEKEKNLEPSEDQPFIGKILRKVTDEDLQKIAHNEKKSQNAYETVAKKVAFYELDMKLTDVQYTFDCSKLFVYYTSESRVDFRELIKDLGSALKTRIQMVQIGVRDESKMIGGLGICGRTLCCQNFLADFSSVTIDMAKEQDLSINTSKLSGLCGRLLCCISYENEYYKEIKKGLPKIGDMILTPNGKGKFAAIDSIKQIITVEFSQNNNKEFQKYPIDIIKDLNKESDK